MCGVVHELGLRRLIVMWKKTVTFKDLWAVFVI